MAHKLEQKLLLQHLFPFLNDDVDLQRVWILISKKIKSCQIVVVHNEYHEENIAELLSL